LLARVYYAYGTTPPYASIYVPEPRHLKQVNILFCDGHVSEMAYWPLVKGAKGYWGY